MTMQAVVYNTVFDDGDFDNQDDSNFGANLNDIFDANLIDIFDDATRKSSSSFARLSSNVKLNNNNVTVYDNTIVYNTVYDTYRYIRRGDWLGASGNNEDNNIKRTNNKSLTGTTNNSTKHNEVSNDNNIEYNPSYYKGGRLIKYDYIDAHGIDYISKANVDNSTEANGHNKQKTIKIQTNNHDE